MRYAFVTQHGSMQVRDPVRKRGVKTTVAVTNRPKTGNRLHKHSLHYGSAAAQYTHTRQRVMSLRWLDASI
jgi:hypothetical protein